MKASKLRNTGPTAKTGGVTSRWLDQDRVKAAGTTDRGDASNPTDDNVIVSGWNYTSIVAAIALHDPTVGAAFSRLTTVAPRPQDAAGIGRVCCGSLKTLQTVMSWIGAPASGLLEIESVLSALHGAVARELQGTGTRELALPLRGRTGKYPQWSVLAAMADANIPTGALLAGGVELLRAWKDAREISKAATADIAVAMKDDALSDEALRLLLDGVAEEEDITSAWQKRLQRSWRHVVRYFGEDGSPLPPANFQDRVRGQILESSVFASPTRRAGASDHRQLSKLQLKDVLAQIARWIDGDDFRGTFGFMACCTGFTADLIALVPLQSPVAPVNWVVVIDVGASCLKMDVSCVADQAAGPSMEAAIISNFVCTKPMPANLAVGVRARIEKYPSARCLGDLYPEATDLNARASVIPCSDEIKPSWARLRHSSGTFMRHIGIDNLLACMISGDFGHVPRSKLYYACVEPQELFEATERFYHAAGWGEPVHMPTDTLAFGCRVVPTMPQIRKINQWWLQAANGMLPPKRCALAQVLEHHNRFMATTGFRLALLLALRQQKQYGLCADVDERVDLWLGVDDKHVPGLSGALPVPLTQFSAGTIGAVRAHCRALSSRLHQHRLQYSELARWSDGVVRRQAVPLLMKASSPNKLQEVGTHDCLGPLPPELVIAPDFGRKVMENALRKKGLRTGDIDAVLRHTVLGQSRATAISDFNLLEWLQRVTPVMDQIATDLFRDVYFGLARE